MSLQSNKYPYYFTAVFSSAETADKPPIIDGKMMEFPSLLAIVSLKAALLFWHCQKFFFNNIRSGFYRYGTDTIKKL